MYFWQRVRNSLEGRIGRKHYILSSVLIILVCMVVFLVDLAVFGVTGFLGKIFNMPETVVATIKIVLLTTSYFITYLIVSIFALFVCIKRFHDIGASGYWVLLLFLPLINIFPAASLLIRKGEAKPNLYGKSTSSMPFFKAIFTSKQI